MGSVLEWPLLNGSLPVAVAALGITSLVYLLAGRRWSRVVPAAGLAVLLTVLGVAVVVDGVWRPFPEGLPGVVLAWAGVAVFGFALAVARSRDRAGTGRRWRRSTPAAAAAGVLLASASQVNLYFAW